MAGGYDVIVIGGGLGGLIAAGLVARAERKTLLIERNHDVGGAATTYKAGGLVVEASLHETSDPRDPIHHVLTRLGVLDDIDWIPTGAIYEVRGGLLGEPFVLPEAFAPARHALLERFHRPRPVSASCLGRWSASQRLRARLYEAELQRREAVTEAMNATKTDIGWGHQIRSYVLQPYQMVKDLRTGVETGNTGAVLDGDIDRFLAAALAARIKGADAITAGA